MKFWQLVSKLLFNSNNSNMARVEKSGTIWWTTERSLLKHTRIIQFQEISFHRVEIVLYTTMDDFGDFRDFDIIGNGE